MVDDTDVIAEHADRIADEKPTHYGASRSSQVRVARRRPAGSPGGVRACTSVYQQDLGALTLARDRDGAHGAKGRGSASTWP
jgi:hypothetical protein